MKLHWTKPARADLDRLYDYLLDYSTQAADEAIIDIIDSTNSLRQNPELGYSFKDSRIYRQLIVPYVKRGYMVRYYILEDTIVITRIWHGLEDR